MTWNSLTTNSTATYTCESGYQLTGDQTRTCQNSGLWSGQAPRCICTSKCKFMGYMNNQEPMRAEGPKERPTIHTHNSTICLEAFRVQKLWWLLSLDIMGISHFRHSINSSSHLLFYIHFTFHILCFAFPISQFPFHIFHFTFSISCLAFCIWLLVNLYNCYCTCQ